MSDAQIIDSVQTHRFPCHNCGADYRYAPGTDFLQCDHCGNAEEIEARGYTSAELRELDYDSAVADLLPSAETEEIRSTDCPNCAATFEFDPAVHAAECPFCATPVVADTGTNRHIKPRGVLPFALQETEAKAAMVDWLGRLWFAPSSLTDYARKGRKMQGIYVPYWTFDADTQSRYSGARGTVYYETRTVTRNGRRESVRVAKVRWRSVSGSVKRFFDDVLVLASRSLPKRFTDALEPWDLSALEPYRPEYLAGFRAEAYTVELQEGFAEASGYIARIIERDVKFDIGGDRQRIHNIETRTGAIKFKHVLLPVWLAAYKYNGKTYRFVVNGRTGRVQGERPYSGWKIAFAVIGGALIAGAIGYLIAVSQDQNGVVIFDRFIR